MRADRRLFQNDPITCEEIMRGQANVLQEIHSHINQIFDWEVRLGEAMDGLVQELEDAEVHLMV